MKKIICIIATFLMCLAFAACAVEKPDDPISSGDESMQNTESEPLQSEPTSQIVESTTDKKSVEESSIAQSVEPSAPVEQSAEEQNEQSEENTVSEPFLSIAPEYFPYRTLSAHSAKELAAKIVELNDELNKDDVQKFDPDEQKYFVNLGKIISDGFILNPSFSGNYAETEDISKSSAKIEMIFWDTGSINIIYYCRNDDDIWAMVQVEYPNDTINDLISKHGIDGYRMYYSKSDKPIQKYTEAERAALTESVDIKQIALDGSEYTAIKYGKSSRNNAYTVTIEIDGKVINLNYKYKNDETMNPDDILNTIRFDKVELN